MVSTEDFVKEQEILLELVIFNIIIFFSSIKFLICSKVINYLN